MYFTYFTLQRKDLWTEPTSTYVQSALQMSKTTVQDKNKVSVGSLARPEVPKSLASGGTPRAHTLAFTTFMTLPEFK